MAKLKDNRAIAMLDKAAKEKYAISAVVVHNLEGTLATLAAATALSSPAMLLFFPWALTTIPALIHTTHILSLSAPAPAPVPITLHLDYAQTPALVRRAPDSRCFDSIMVDMSHHARDENLRLTASLAAYRHDRGIAVEAEPGRIEGGEDGVRDTAGPGRRAHEPRRSARVRSHGTSTGSLRLSVTCTAAYGPRGIQLDCPRLESINRAVGGDVRLVRHGTDGFDAGVYKRCIQGGVSQG